MIALFGLINTVLQLYMWVIIAGAVLSWLVAFEVVNTRNRLVALVLDFTYRLSEPALRPIRRILPSISGIDLSPVVLILGIIFVQNLLYEYMAPRLVYN